MKRVFAFVLLGSLVGFGVPVSANALTGLTNTVGMLTTFNSAGVAVEVDSVIAGTDGGNVSCSLDSTSPAVAAFNIGDLVAIDCQQGVLTVIRPLTAPLSGIAEPLPQFSHTRQSPTPGPDVTTEQCATAWNATSTSSERLAVTRLHPLAASVRSGTVTDIGVGSSRATGPTCQITFILPAARTIIVDGYWEHVTVPAWHASVLTQFLSTDQAGFIVEPNGSIHHQ